MFLKLGQLFPGVQLFFYFIFCLFVVVVVVFFGGGGGNWLLAKLVANTSCGISTSTG